MSSTRAVPVLALFLASALAPGCGDSDPIQPLAPLTISGGSPSTGPPAGGTSMTITGSNFIDVTSVTIGGTELVGRTVVSTTQITGTTPPSSLGVKDVTVTSSSHGSDTCNGCFNYMEEEPPPPPPLEFAALSLGDEHTCALTLTGAAYCWGKNQSGQLGDASRASSSVPVPVLGELTFASLEVGLEHSCGLTSTGEAFCWGSNQSGALGNGTTVDRATPVRVLGGLSFASVSAGWSHTCGVTAEGVAYCWGFNLSGELGNGTTGGTATAPEPVVGGLNFTSVVAGGAHTCGLTAEGTAYCWGNNTEGELGDGTQSERLSPTPVVGGLSFTSLSASFGYTCGVTTEGDAYCWGFNASGRLGSDNPAENVRSSPSLVAGGLSFTSISVGKFHGCGVTTGGDVGDAYCWGFNGSGSENGGNLGDGTTINRSTPVAVVGELTFTAVEAGGDHSCGLATTGDAYCWGNNQSGELGNGFVIASTRPVKVAKQ